MNDSDGWLERYGESHQHIRYPPVYWAAVPAVVTGTVGLLWTLPVPGEFVEISPFLNWGSAFLMVATVYYFIISLAIAIGMLPFVLGVAAFQLWLESSDYSLARVSGGLLVAGVIGLWLGRRRLLAVLSDLQLMVIGPAWLLSRLYRRAGIPF